jgi:hypothetical protein
MREHARACSRVENAARLPRVGNMLLILVPNPARCGEGLERPERQKAQASQEVGGSLLGGGNVEQRIGPLQRG